MIATLTSLMWVFLRIGTVSFGGGLVIIPLVQTEVVDNYGWLTQQEFLDAVTLGQITPGPIIISATFIGYRACGFLGALVATVSVILPSFIMICLATKAIEKFRKNRTLADFLRGARVAVIGMVFEASMSIGRGALIDAKTCVIAALSFFVLFMYKVNPIWVLLGAGIIGLII